MTNPFIISLLSILLCGKLVFSAKRQYAGVVLDPSCFPASSSTIRLKDPKTNEEYDDVSTTSMFQKLINDKTKTMYLGKGQFGKVYKTTYKGLTVAVKRTKIDDLNIKEINLLIKLKGITGISNIIDCEVDDHFLYFAQDLLDIPVNIKTMPLIRGKPLAERLRLYADLTETLEKIHEKGIVHADIKTENLMLDKDVTRIFLIDFGLSKTEQEYLYAGTPDLWSPEFLNNKRKHKINKVDDMWSFALTLAELEFGPHYLYDNEYATCIKESFPLKCYTTLMENIQNAKNKMYVPDRDKCSKDVYENFVNALIKSLSFEPSGRYSTTQLKTVLNDIKDKCLELDGSFKQTPPLVTNDEADKAKPNGPKIIWTERKALGQMLPQKILNDSPEANQFTQTNIAQKQENPYKKYGQLKLGSDKSAQNAQKLLETLPNNTDEHEAGKTKNPPIGINLKEGVHQIMQKYLPGGVIKNSPIKNKPDEKRIFAGLQKPAEEPKVRQVSPVEVNAEINRFPWRFVNPEDGPYSVFDLNLSWAVSKNLETIEEIKKKHMLIKLNPLAGNVAAPLKPDSSSPGQNRLELNKGVLRKSPTELEIIQEAPIKAIPELSKPSHNFLKPTENSNIRANLQQELSQPKTSYTRLKLKEERKEIGNAGNQIGGFGTRIESNLITRMNDIQGQPYTREINIKPASGNGVVKKVVITQKEPVVNTYIGAIKTNVRTVEPQQTQPQGLNFRVVQNDVKEAQEKQAYPFMDNPTQNFLFKRQDTPPTTAAKMRV